MRNNYAIPQGKLVRLVTAVEAPAPTPRENPFHIVPGGPALVEGLEFKTGPHSSDLPRRKLVRAAIVAPSFALLVAVVIGYTFSQSEGSSMTATRAAASGNVAADDIIHLTRQYSLPRAALLAPVEGPLPSPGDRRTAIQVLPFESESPLSSTDYEPSPPARVHSGGPSSIQPPRVPARGALVGKVYQVIREYSPKNANARNLAEAIVDEAKVQSFDPLFVAAVIKSESTFNSFARSNKGAQGLMQLMPKTGAWLADKEEIPHGRLTDPGYNLKLGITYLKHLHEMYRGDKIFILIAYNWGPGRVESATSGKRRVPPEVMTYAVKIMNDYRRWVSEV